MTTVMIVDSHPIVREGIKNILSGAGFEVQSETPQDDQVLQSLESIPCVAILLEIASPPPGGFDLLRQIKAVTSQIPVLIFSILPEEEYGLAALRADAAGYLSKDCSAETVISAVRTV